MVLPTPPFFIPTLPKHPRLQDVEFYTHYEPSIVLTAEQVEWLIVSAQHIDRVLVELTRTQQQNRLLRKWWYGPGHHIQIQTPEAKKLVRETLHSKAYGAVYWMWCHCRLCGTKLWSGLSSHMRPPKAMPEILRRHKYAHLQDCMDFIKKEALEGISTVRRR